ncbi:TetR/AcrR family transcriptional regulator [Psychrobacillus sp.]|uniref:TetR/AcrR family transcriptional regulator n=1 Tax=Psychrobacillus sp. TaxID=1871623 RepID=UPI0028BD5362|nr:TetR/AcrR family transcriptional regulator [Psychrobacillus sp.]
MTNRKSQIIQLTIKNIQEKGYLSFSYDDLAKELGVTKASIHYHFEKKGDLGVAVCEKIQAGLEKNFLEVDQAEIKIADKPLEFILIRVQQIGNNGVCPLSALQADYNYLPTSMQQKVQQISQLEINLLVRLLAGAKQEGRIQTVEDLESLAVLLISSTKGGLQYRRVLGDTFFSKVLEQFKDLLK